MGGTSEKIIEKYKKFRNNFVAASTIFTDESKLLIFYPTQISKNSLKKILNLSMFQKIKK